MWLQWNAAVAIFRTNSTGRRMTNLQSHSHPLLSLDSSPHPVQFSFLLVAHSGLSFSSPFDLFLIFRHIPIYKLFGVGFIRRESILLPPYEEY
jgi:hypothetical protein